MMGTAPATNLEWITIRVNIPMAGASVSANRVLRNALGSPIWNR
jgi:hypothetical protein